MELLPRQLSTSDWTASNNRVDSRVSLASYVEVPVTYHARMQEERLHDGKKERLHEQFDFRASIVSYVEVPVTYIIMQYFLLRKIAWWTKRTPSTYELSDTCQYFKIQF